MGRPIKIAHVITGLDAGGAETMLHKLVSRADDSRCQHRIISLTDIGVIGRKIQAEGVPVRALGVDRQRPASLLRAAIRLRGLIRRSAPDVIQTWLYHADLLGLLVGLATRTPVIWNIRSTYHPGLASPVGKACQRLSRFPAAIIVNSVAGRELYARCGYRPRRWVVLPNGFDTAQFAPDEQARDAVREELGLPRDAPIIGMVARFDPLKDYPTFLEAVRLLHQERPSIYFLAIGRGVTAENETLRTSLDTHDLRGVVRLLGERTDIARLTAAFDIATLSSYSEGFPNVIGEAMAIGIPCAVTDVGDAARIVGDTGRVVPARDARALADAWRALIDLGAAGRAILGKRARARVEDEFSLRAILHRYDDLYHEVAIHRTGAV